MLSLPRFLDCKRRQHIYVGPFALLAILANHAAWYKARINCAGNTRLPSLVFPNALGRLPNLGHKRTSDIYVGQCQLGCLVNEVHLGLSGFSCRLALPHIPPIFRKNNKIKKGICQESDGQKERLFGFAANLNDTRNLRCIMAVLLKHGRKAIVFGISSFQHVPNVANCACILFVLAD